MKKITNFYLCRRRLNKLVNHILYSKLKVEGDIFDTVVILFPKQWTYDSLAPVLRDSPYKSLIDNVESFFKLPYHDSLDILFRDINCDDVESVADRIYNFIDKKGFALFGYWYTPIYLWNTVIRNINYMLRK